jgi:O-antigen/teichoic acid export membrane protein
VRQLAAAALLPAFGRDRRRCAAAGGVRGSPSRARADPAQGALWFFLLAATDFVALSVDAVVVGHSRGAAQLGFYSLAFTLPFAPLTNFAWQIGEVIFPAAAQTPLLPGVLPQEWKAMVVPFQILVAVGVGHAILVALGDSLSGVGAISWRARLHLVWSLAMIVALVALVRLDGITGATLAHLQPGKQEQVREEQAG